MQRELKGSTQIRLILDFLIFISGGISVLIFLLRGIDIIPMSQVEIKHALRIFAVSLSLRWLLDGWLDRKMAGYPFWNGLLNSRGWHYCGFAFVLMLCLRSALRIEFDAPLILIFCTLFILWIGLLNLYELIITLGASTCRAFFLSLALFLGTGLFLSATLSATNYQQAMNFTFCTAYIHFTVRWGRNARGAFKWLVLGIFAGLSALVYLPNLLLIPMAPLIAFLVMKNLQKNELEVSESLFYKQLIIYFAATLFAFQPHIIVWILQNMYDPLGPISQTQAATNLIIPLLLGWPLIFIAALGFQRFCQITKPLAIYLILFFVISIGLAISTTAPIDQSMHNFFSSIPLIAIGLHFLYDALRKKTQNVQRIVTIAIFLATLWTFCANVHHLNQKTKSTPQVTSIKNEISLRWKTIRNYFL